MFPGQPSLQNRVLTAGLMTLVLGLPAASETPGQDRSGPNLALTMPEAPPRTEGTAAVERLAGLFGCPPVCASALELAPTTIDGEQSAEPGLALDQSSGMASRLGLCVRETPASVAIANRNDIA